MPASGKLIHAAMQFLKKVRKRVEHQLKTVKLKITRPKPPHGAGHDWKPRVADNGKGVVWQKPGATGNQHMLRSMDPTPAYPHGYVRFHNQYGQPVDLHGHPGPKSTTHIGKNPDGTYPIPSGWSP